MNTGFYLKHSRACLYTYTLIENFLNVILLRCPVSKSSASCRLAYLSTNSLHFMNENFEKRKKLQFNKQTKFLHDSREVVTSFIAQNSQSALFSRQLKSVCQVTAWRTLFQIVRKAATLRNLTVKSLFACCLCVVTTFRTFVQKILFDTCV